MKNLKSARSQHRIRHIGAVSILALLSASCASRAADRRSEDGANSDWRVDDRYAQHEHYNEQGERAAYREGGIETARDAHRRFSEYRAEKLDGNCERRVSVEYGETLSDIAELCDVSVASLIDANSGIRNPNSVEVGQRLSIPDERASVYRDSYGRRWDTGNTIEERRRESRRNREDRHDGDQDYHVVRRGDTLNEIAYLHDVTLQEILRLNAGVRARELEIGDRIYLPDQRRVKSDRKVSIETTRPSVTFSPRTGPRNGEIRVFGESLERGEQVAVLYGDTPGRLVRIRSIHADEHGKVDELVRLPEEYQSEEAYFAMQRGEDTFISQSAYAIERKEGLENVSTIAGAHVGQNYVRLQPRQDSPAAVLRAVDREVYRDDSVTLSAKGFPSNTPVSIYGGPDRNSLSKISEVRTGPSGLFTTSVKIPEGFSGESVLFVAAVEDGARTYFTERVRVHARDAYNYDGQRFNDNSSAYRHESDFNLQEQSSTTLARGVDRQRRSLPTILSGLRYGDQSTSADIIKGRPSAISGVLTNEGKACLSMRDDAGNLYTLLGDLRGFGDGDRVLIRGSAAADDRICNQAKTVHIFGIESAPW